MADSWTSPEALTSHANRWASGGTTQVSCDPSAESAGAGGANSDDPTVTVAPWVNPSGELSCKLKVCPAETATPGNTQTTYEPGPLTA